MPWLLVMEAANQPSRRNRIMQIRRSAKYFNVRRIRGDVQDRSTSCK
jgi:hypothetical protein